MPAAIVEVSEAAPHLPLRGALLGLDIGTKTIGVATSDADRRLATGVETIFRKTFTLDARRVLALAAERRCAGFVLGLPLNKDGSEGPRAQSTRAFHHIACRRVVHQLQLKQSVGIVVHIVFAHSRERGKLDKDGFH